MPVSPEDLARRCAVDSHTFVGAYEFALEEDAPRRRIRSLRFDLKFIKGNLVLEKAS